MSGRASAVQVERLPQPGDAHCRGLARVLIECVEAGASVGFMSPLGQDQALAYWRRIAREAAAGERALFVAQHAGEILGTVQLVLAQPDNQPHRADLAKMLVRPDCRRLGIGERLLRAAMAAAPGLGRHVLVLDTASIEAERLYERNGWQVVGEVPEFALLPHGGYCRTRFYFHRSDPPSTQLP
jgi:GNAT superfamily N-acetyltransferase